MKTHVVIDSKGHWQLMNKIDANTHMQCGYEVKSIKYFIWTFAKTAVPIGILFTIMMTVNSISNRDLRMGFLILIMLRLLNLVKW